MTDTFSLRGHIPKCPCDDCNDARHEAIRLGITGLEAAELKSGRSQLAYVAVGERMQQIIDQAMA